MGECDFPDCRRAAEHRLPAPFDRYALCGRCRAWRYLAFLIWAVSRR